MASGRLPYRIEFAPSAVKQLGGLPVEVQRQIAPRIEGLSQEPRPQGCKKLKGRQNEYRIRIGDYRVIYSIGDKHLIVLYACQE